MKYSYKFINHMESQSSEVGGQEIIKFETILNYTLSSSPSYAKRVSGNPGLYSKVLHQWNQTNIRKLSSEARSSKMYRSQCKWPLASYWEAFRNWEENKSAGALRLGRRKISSQTGSQCWKRKWSVAPISNAEDKPCGGGAHL